MILDAFVLNGTIEWYTIVCAVWIIVFTALFASKPPIQLVKGVPKDEIKGKIMEESESELEKNGGENGKKNEGKDRTESNDSTCLIPGEIPGTDSSYSSKKIGDSREGTLTDSLLGSGEHSGKEIRDHDSFILGD